MALPSLNARDFVDSIKNVSVSDTTLHRTTYARESTLLSPVDPDGLVTGTKRSSTRTEVITTKEILTSLREAPSVLTVELLVSWLL